LALDSQELVTFQKTLLEYEEVLDAIGWPK
jgi:hypothetical protein